MFSEWPDLFTVGILTFKFLCNYFITIIHLFFYFYLLPQNLQKFYLVFSYCLSDNSKKIHTLCGPVQFILMVTAFSFLKKIFNWKITHNSQECKLHEGKDFYFLFISLPKCLIPVTGTQYHAMNMCWMKDWIKLISGLLCEGPWQMPTLLLIRGFFQSWTESLESC